jgi:pilus assembly protein CpaD
MDMIASKDGMAGGPARGGASRVCRTAIILLACASIGAPAGCAKRDSITVGAVPDDYRTNHPIVIAEKDEVIDLPVGAGDRGMTNMQRAALAGFLDGYDRSAAPVVTIAVPTGAANDVAAAEAASGFRRFIRSRGVPESRIAMVTYPSPSPEISAPIRVSYTAMRAQTNKCGRWPDDLLETSENKHYANFGCAYQNNLAAQVANPADLLGPRKQTEIDAENRDRVIDVYRERGISDEFLDKSEVEVDF